MRACVRVYSTVYPTRSRIVRLQVKSDRSVFDPAVQSYVLEQVSHRTSLKFCEILFFNSPVIRFLLFSNIFQTSLILGFWVKSISFLFFFWLINKSLILIPRSSRYWKKMACWRTPEWLGRCNQMEKSSTRKKRMICN